MRFEIQGENRLGITRDVINVITDHKLDIRNLEVTTHHIYADIPGIQSGKFALLSHSLLQIPGINDVRKIDRLPTERRRAQLHATLAALGDPVIAVDASGQIAQANPAAQILSDTPAIALRDQDITAILSDPSIDDLRQSGFRLPERDVTVGGQTYLLQVEPIGHMDDGSESSDDADTPWGGVMIFHRAARLGRVITALQDRSHTGFDDIIGDSHAMMRVKSQAERLAAIDAPLLILGETGTGKELFARACHRASTRADHSFLTLNCAAMPEGLAESELFGYAAGAFTSARRGGKPGLLELADGGTLFLDEIGELSPYLQAKLLRVLQDGRFRRVGGTDEITVDVRIISATNRDLETMSQDGTFREDLYFRLNVLGITLPPLRERAEDIPALAKVFIDRTAAQTERPSPILTQDALAWLKSHDWPGNVRELENTLFRAVALLDGNSLRAPDLNLAARGTAPAPAHPHDISSDTSADLPHNSAPSGPDPITAALAAPSLNDGMERLEREILTRLYPDYPSSRKLAERLGISHTAIARKLAKYNIKS
ncbi:sigma 54-interacting transcriptional regulator [Thalassospira sp. MA62]|nr:sigma 54-interacting transcriptional regulator [Thalassospira sp. MA62]